MCGIAGYIGSKNISDKLISKSLDFLKSRGPDFKGIKKYNGNSQNSKNILFLHTRLSIIDLEAR